MDFQRLTRRELQALCKLNKIPANITNVAMADALVAIPIVEGIEEFLMPSQMSEITESSMESPLKTEVMSPRVPRTGCRTSTRQNLLRGAAESVQTVTRTTRRGVRSQTAGEPDEHKTAVPETPAVSTGRTRRATAASARHNMDIQLKESGGYEDSIHLDKKCVPETAAPVPNSQGKVPAASIRRTNLKESVVGRTYSTRRSARLKVAEPAQMDKERKELGKAGFVSEEKKLSFGEKLDEEFDDLNAVGQNSSISGPIEVDVDVIPSGLENPIELCRLESLDKDVDTEETAAADIKIKVQENIGNKDFGVDVHPSEKENLSETLNSETVNNVSSDEDTGSVDVPAAEIKVRDALVNKGAEVYLSETENSNETLEIEIVEKVDNFEDMDSDEKTAADMEIVVLENKGGEEYLSDIDNRRETSKIEIVEKVANFEDMDSDEKTAADMESVVLENKGGVEYLSDIGNPSETLEMEIVKKFGTFEDIDSDERSAADKESILQENHAEVVSPDIEKPDEPQEAYDIFAENPLLNDAENPAVAKIESEIILSGSEKLNELEDAKNSSAEEPLLDYAESQFQAKIQSDLLKLSDSAAQDQNQASELPKVHPVEDMKIGEANQELLGLVIEDIGAEKISGSDETANLDLTDMLDGEKVAGITETHNSKQANEGVNEAVMDISVDFSSFFPFSCMPSSEVAAIPTHVSPSKISLKKSASKTPANSRRKTLVSDDKENIDRSGKMLQPAKDVGKMIKKEKTENDKLYDASLRQLTKMLKEKLQITNSVRTVEEETNVTKVATTRSALQTLSSNSLARS